MFNARTKPFLFFFCQHTCERIEAKQKGIPKDASNKSDSIITIKKP